MIQDTYGRIIQYLRLSVTDLCNYRCIYCMGPEGVAKKHHSDILSIEELTAIVKACCDLGIRKVRLTGGEPLVRKGILSLCRNIRSISDEIELSITTNGSLLGGMAKDLREAGVDRLNISLDTVDRETFSRITRGGNIDDIWDGINAAKKAGFDNIKINTVLLGGINDSEIWDMIRLTKDLAVQWRFIELMPIGVAKSWEKERFITVAEIENYLRHTASMTIDGVARVYQLPEHKGTIGLITPLSHSFCPSCDKIRVTADGKLKPCLHSEAELDLRGLQGEALTAAIINGIQMKPSHHNLYSGESDTARMMNEIGG